MATITEACEELHQRIENRGLSPMKHGIYDDEDLIVFALHFMGRNLDDVAILWDDEEDD